MRFKDQVVIVTGASRGIGRAIATAFANEGALVACIATSQSNADATASLLPGAKGYALNVADAAEVSAVFDAIEKDLGVPSVLVNNAGITRDQLLMRMKDEDFDAVISVNLRGTYLCTKAVTRAMMKARYGRIINISSIVGLHGAAGQANYAASKAGMIGLTLAVAKELGPRGITANAVAPGFIETDMTAELDQKMKDGVIASAPIGRLGSAEDIANAVVFLASPDSGYITGQTITVDGGLSL
jgi:3-oxoacyl-[acyl-carrier protein] reductase